MTEVVLFLSALAIAAFVYVVGMGFIASTGRSLTPEWVD